MVINPVYPHHRVDAPASFIHSTIIDMCHWSINSLNGGEYKGNRILSADRYPRSSWFMGFAFPCYLILYPAGRVRNVSAR